MQNSKQSQKTSLQTSNGLTPDEIISQAISNNATDAPHVSIDPDTNKMGIVGDPNEIGRPDGKYSLEFEYTEDMLSEEEKVKLEYDEDMDRYYLTIHYENKRIKPLYRSRIVLILTKIMAELGILDESGYTSEQQLTMISEGMIRHAEDIAEIAHMVLGVEKEQLEYMTDTAIFTFFNDFMRNEPNILKECVVFLMRRTPNAKAEKKKKN